MQFVRGWRIRESCCALAIRQAGKKRYNHSTDSYDGQKTQHAATKVPVVAVCSGFKRYGSPRNLQQCAVAFGVRALTSWHF